jgi:hypothetical protein
MIDWNVREFVCDGCRRRERSTMRCMASIPPGWISAAPLAIQAVPNDKASRWTVDYKEIHACSLACWIKMRRRELDELESGMRSA